MALSVRVVVCLLLTTLAAGAHALTWTNELCLTPAGEDEGSPCLAIGPNGQMHAVYVADLGSGQRLYHRLWLGSAWTNAVTLPGPGFKTASAQIDITPDNHVHLVAIFRPDGNALPYTVYYWEYNGFTWVGPTQLSDGQGGEGDNCASPRVCADRLGTVHVIWSEGNKVGNKADLMYRRRGGGSWYPAANLTNNGASVGYGSCAPDMCLDAGGDGIHVVWHDGFTGKDLLYYTKSPDLGNTWPIAAQWQLVSGAEYGKGASMVLDRNNYPSIWWTDMDGAGTKFAAYRRWNGSAWTAIENWGGRSVLDAAFDSNNLMRVVYRWTDTELYYCTYNFASFSTPELVGLGPDTYKADAASIVLNSANYASVLWEERKGEWPGIPGIYFSTAIPLPAPSPVSSFRGQSSDSLVRLYWTNPSNVNFLGTLIRRKIGSYPTSPTDGALVCDRTAALGSADSFIDTGLSNGVAYYYAAWAHDSNGQYSNPSYVVATPGSQTIAAIKQIADISPVDLYGMVVSAVFTADAVIYVTDQDRVSGIRVSNSGAGLKAGDIVNVSGVMNTRKLSSYPAERYISGATVTKIQDGPEPTPVFVRGVHVGGAANGLAPGVAGGVGVNTMGCLVKIAGVVRNKSGQALYVDDGSGVIDPMGSIGVMVKYPTATVPYVIGDRISVVGIVEGSIPLGQTANRRLVRGRVEGDFTEF